MDRYYQYLIGENRGKVVLLKEIDDTMPDMILYCFDDGFRCNEELIAPLNDWNITNKVMAQVENSINIWKFSEKKIEAQVKEASGKDGQIYEAPDPYFIDKNGGGLGKERREIIMEHPRRTTNTSSIRDLDNYYISNKKVEKTDEQEVVQTKETTEAKITNLQDSQTDRIFRLPVNPETNSIEINYNNESILEFINGDVKTSFNVQDIIDSLKSVLKKTTEKDVEKTFENDATVLYNKCAKEEATVTLKIDLDLPSLSLFKSIKENYPEGWDKMFIENVVNNIEISDLKNKLIDSLYNQYNYENNAKKL